MTQHPASVAYVDGMRVWQSFGTYVHVLTGNFSHLFVPGVLYDAMHDDEVTYWLVMI